MIVREFLLWIETAVASERAEASSALARAYLYSDLTDEDRAAAEAAMLMLLDDPAPVVRMALADALGHSPDAPPSVILGLLGDQPEIAARAARHSPLLVDVELVDIVGAGGPQVQVAVAERDDLPVPVAAAIAEVGCEEACEALLRRETPALPRFSIDRIVERFGEDPEIRDLLMARADLPAETRQALIVKLSGALARFAAGRDWLGDAQADRIARDATEKATIALAESQPASELPALVRHLRLSGQLTAGLMLRALLSGQVAFLEASLAELSGLGLKRASGLVHDRRGGGFRALYEEARMPMAAFPAFQAALAAWREGQGGDGLSGGARLRRQMVERALTASLALSGGEMDVIVAMLRRFALEAARDEARLFTQELISAPALIADAREEPPLLAA